MIKPADLKQAIDFVSECWGEEVVEKALNAKTQRMPIKEFLTHCTACGGNWGGMLLTGIRELAPEVWDAIPDDMGVYAFTVICNTLMLLGVDTSDEE